MNGDSLATTAEIGAGVAMALLSLALLLTFVRLILGPTLPDRVMALDLMGVLTVGTIAAYSVITDEPVLLDPATVLALVGFLGTMAFARYIERRTQQ